MSTRAGGESRLGKGKVSRIITSFGIGVLFILAFLWFEDNIGMRSFVNWVPLVPPPEKVERLVGIGVMRFPKQIYLETEGSNIYRCCERGASGWILHDGGQEWVERACRDDLYLRYPQVKSPPGGSVACLELAHQEGVPDDAYYALAGDGTVYRLRFHQPLFVSLGLLCGSGILGILVGWGVSTVFSRRTASIEDEYEAS